MQKIQRPIIFFLIFATMFVLGGIQNTKGIILEKVQNDIQLDISQVGVMVSVFQIGFLLASLIAGILADRKGIKVAMSIGTALMMIGFNWNGGCLYRCLLSRLLSDGRAGHRGDDRVGGYADPHLF